MGFSEVVGLSPFLEFLFHLFIFQLQFIKLYRSSYYHTFITLAAIRLQTSICPMTKQFFQE